MNNQKFLRVVLAVCVSFASAANADTPLRQGTIPAPIPIGPFGSSTSPYGAATSLTLTQPDFLLMKNGGTQAQKNDTSSGTHLGGGIYSMQLNATDVNTVGTLTVSVNESGAFPWGHTYQVIPAAVYDRLYGSTADGPATAAEVRSSTGLRGPGLITGNGSTRGYAALLGSDEIIGGRADVEPKLRAVADAWLDMCPIDRTTTMYFDAQNGNDSNNGLTELTPKQTITAINSAVAAGRTLRCKGEWITNTTVNLNQACTLTSWSNRGPPIFNGMRLSIASGAAAWTNAAGNVWTATLANAGSLHPRTWGIWHEMTVCPDAATVSSNAESYFINTTTNVITINWPTDPNLIAWEANHRSDYGSFCSGVEISAHGARVHNVVCHHNGYGAYGSGTNQSWGIRAIQTGESVVAITDVECAGHYAHNLGHLVSTGSGGRTYIRNARVGGCLLDASNDAATLLVDYAELGLNECIFDNVFPVNGRIPQSSKIGVRSFIRFMYSHTTSSSYRIGLGAAIDCGMSDYGQVPCEDYGSFGGGPGTYSDITTLRAFHIRPNILPTGGLDSSLPIQAGNVFMGGLVRLKPNYTSNLAVSNYELTGWAFSTTFIIDWSRFTGWTTNIVGLTNTTPALLSGPKFIHCRVHQQGGLSGSSREYALLRIANIVGHNANMPSKAINSIFTSDYATSGALYYIAIGNVGATSGEFKNNGIFGYQNEATYNRGYTTWLNTIAMTDMPNIGAYDVRLRGLGGPEGAICEIDGLCRPLAHPGEHIGPWGELADVIGRQYTLTPAQLAQLQAAGLALPATSYTTPPTTGAIVTAINADGTQTTARTNAATAGSAATAAANQTTPAAIRTTLGLAAANMDSQFSLLGSPFQAGSYVVPPTVGAIRTEMDNNSTRLATIDTEGSTIITQTSPSSLRAGLGLAAANLDTQFSTIGSPLQSGSYTAPPSVSAIRTEMDSNSTRLATIASQTLPSAIRAGLGMAAANMDTQFSLIPDIGDVQTATGLAILDKLPAGETEIAAAGAVAKTLDDAAGGGGAGGSPGGALFSLRVADTSYAEDEYVDIVQGEQKILTFILTPKSGLLAAAEPVSIAVKLKDVKGETVNIANGSVTRVCEQADIQVFRVTLSAADSADLNVGLLRIEVTIDNQKARLNDALRIVEAL